MGRSVNGTIVYIHGKGGNAEEADHYKPLFPQYRLVGFDYRSQTPWEAEDEFPAFFESVQKGGEPIAIIANSIGAFFTMHALAHITMEKAWFVSPIVDMEKLIIDMMHWSGVSERELREKGSIDTAFGETLSWEYLTWVREHPIVWRTPSSILYAGRDHLQSLDTMLGFAKRIGADVTIMEGGEHWLHTDEQMRFLDCWIERSM